MKFFEKLGLLLFSSLILLLCVILIITIFGWLDVNIFTQIIKAGLSTYPANNIILGVCIVFILLAIKCIFFDSSSKSDDSLKSGIMLENTNGKLLISKDTLQNVIINVANNFDSISVESTKVALDKQNNVIIFITLSITEDVVIKELSNNLQNKIIETIKSTSDLEVKQVNIKIKDVIPKKDEIGEIQE